MKLMAIDDHRLICAMNEASASADATTAKPKSLKNAAANSGPASRPVSVRRASKSFSPINGGIGNIFRVLGWLPSHAMRPFDSIIVSAGGRWRTALQVVMNRPKGGAIDAPPSLLFSGRALRSVLGRRRWSPADSVWWLLFPLLNIGRWRRTLKPLLLFGTNTGRALARDGCSFIFAERAPAVGGVASRAHSALPRSRHRAGSMSGRLRQSSFQTGKRAGVAAGFPREGNPPSAAVARPA